MMQAPATQAAVPLATTHWLPQRPQWFVVVRRLVSQPLVGSPSQSPKPTLQTPTPQRPSRHAAVPFGITHVRPQAPQFVALVCVSISQPFIAFMSQSPRPVAQPPITHDPAVHAAVPPATRHMLPQRPQLADAVRTSVSQPLAASPSQSAKPSLHIPTRHTPSAQPGVPLGITHGRPHAPQWVLSVRTSTSQPLAALPSQSA